MPVPLLLKQVVSPPLFIHRWSISQALLSFHFNSFVPGNFAKKRLLKLFSLFLDTKKRVSMGWWLLRLSAKILALLRLSVNFFQLRLTKKLNANAQLKGGIHYNRNGRFHTREGFV